MRLASREKPFVATPRKIFLFLFFAFSLFTCVLLFRSMNHITPKDDLEQPPHPPSGAIVVEGREKTGAHLRTNFRNGKTPLILYYTAVSGFMGSTWLKPPKNCSVTCEFSETHNSYNEADAVVYLLPAFSQGSGFPKKLENQIFVGMSMESELYYTHMKDEKFMSNFDVKMTYRQNADITTMYMSSKANYSATPLAEKSTEALASIFVSNSGPLNERNAAVKGIMDRVPCHSYGRYLRNIESSEDKKSLLRKYKFHLAFENSNTIDYVTEKVFHALAAGTLPIYLGAPNIAEYMPSNKSIIHLADYNGDYEKLTDHMKFLDQNEDEYQKYFEWKSKPYTGNFLKLKNYIKTDARCKLCMKLHGMEIPKLYDILEH